MSASQAAAGLPPSGAVSVGKTVFSTQKLRSGSGTEDLEIDMTTGQLERALRSAVGPARAGVRRSLLAGRGIPPGPRGFHEGGIASACGALQSACSSAVHRNVVTGA